MSSGSYTWTNASAPNGHVGMFVKLNAGLCKITSVTNSTVAVANVIEDMADTQGAAGNEWELNAFSNLDSSKGGGYPRSISFHQNRLIFGGSRDKPQTIFASQSIFVFICLPIYLLCAGRM